MASPGHPFDDVAVRRLLDVVRELSAPTDLQTLLEKVIDAGRKILGADRGTVFLYDVARHELHSKVATGSGEIRIAADQGIAGQAAQERCVVNVRDCYADPRFNQDVDRRTGYRTRCLLTVPLVGLDDALVGVMQLLNKAGGSFDENDEQVATALAAQCAVALQRAQLIEERIVKEKMERDLAIARDIQQRVIPTRMPTVPGYQIAGITISADQTGGDIYDVIPRSGRGLLMLLGDATGHGIGPALSVTQVRSMLRIATRLNASLDDTVRHINAQLNADLSAARFVTAFIGELDIKNHILAYHAAGQGPILHFRNGQERANLISASTVPLGILEDLPPMSPVRLSIAPGEMVALITDGLFEYRNAADEDFGDARILTIIRRHYHQSLDEIIQALLDEVRSFAPGCVQADDVTMLLLRRDA